MFKDIMCLLGGFFTAYLIIKVVRSFRGGVGVGLLLLGGMQPVDAATTYLSLRFHNNTASTYQVLFYGQISPNWYNVCASAGMSVPGYTSQTNSCVLGNDFSAWQCWGKIGSAPNYAGDGTYCGGASTALYYTAGGTYILDATIGTAVQPYTNYWYNINYCNTNKCPVTMTLTFSYPGSNNVVRISPLLQNGSVPDCWDVKETNVFGSGKAFSYSLMRTGCPTEDRVPQLVSNGASSTDGGSAGALATFAQTTRQNGDPGLNSATDGDTNRSDRVIAHQDAMAIKRSIDESADLLDHDMEALYDAIRAGPTNTGSSSNVYSGVLNDIKTNTLATAANTGAIYTNTAGIYTNTLQVSSGDWVTNGMGPFAGLTNIGGGTNAGVWSVGLGSATNGLGNVWSGSVVGTPGALAVSLPAPGGGSYVLDLDVFSSMTGIHLKLLAVAPWIKMWFSWALTYMLFWLVFYHLYEHSVAIGLVASSVPQSSAGGLLQFMTRMGTRATLISVVGGIFAITPVAAMSILHSYGLFSPFSAANGLLESISSISDSGMVSIILTYVDELTIFIPFDTLFLFMTIWPLVFFTVAYFHNFIVIVLMSLGMTLPLFVVGLFSVCQSVDVQAEQVRFENLTGGSIVVSNLVDSSRVLSFAPGVSEDLVLVPGDYVMGTNGFTVAPSGHYDVIRAFGMSDTNSGISWVAFEQAAGYTAVDWWMIGMNLGFAVFGTAWAVSCARSGLLLRVRE